jgi:hypothetical protein
MANKKTPYKFDPITMSAISAGINILGTGANLIGGFSERRKAKEQVTAYEDQLEKSRKAYEQFDYGNIVNPYAGMQIDTRAQELASEQYAQSQADILSQLSAGAGGSGGVAALATAMSRQAAQQAAETRATTAQQEMAIKEKAAAAQLSIDTAAQAAEAERIATLYGIDMEQLAGAEQRLGASSEAIYGGFGDLLGGIGDFVGSGIFNKK